MSPRLAEPWARGWRFLVTGVASNVTHYLVFLLLLWLVFLTRSH